MPFRFRHLALLSAVLFFALAVIWMFMPDRMLATWGVEFSSEAGLISRRAAALYAGIGVMFLLARNAPPSMSRSALVAGFVTICLLLAVLGVFERVTSRAGNGILTAVLVEVTLAVAFLFVPRAERACPSNFL